MEGSTPDPNITQVESLITSKLRLHEDYQTDEGGIYRKNAYITLKLGNLEKRFASGKDLLYPKKG